MAFDVVSFGSGVIDVFVATDVHERKKKISYPVGDKILINDLRFDVGGGGTNTAVAFSRLGLRTGFVGKIGDDENGDRIWNLLKSEKVKFLGETEKGGVSGYSVILDSKEKGRTILTYRGVNNELRSSEIDISKIKTKWLYLTSLSGKSFETQKKLAIQVRERGGKVAYNPSSYLIKKLKLKSFMNFVDVLILNKEEARLLVPKGDLLKGLTKLGPEIVVITDKNKSISCYDGKKKYFLRPHKVKVVERTGAGDAFASGFVAGLIVGKKIPDCLKFGLKESESVIKHFGAKNNLLRMNLKRRWVF